MDSELDALEHAFHEARLSALEFIGAYNAELPSESCPQCGDEGHVPGLKCPACGYRHQTSWAILRDGEWGYEVVELTNRHHVIAAFRVE